MKKIFLLVIALLFISPQMVLARDTSQITDWYIKDFQSTIVVQKDSSILVTEQIEADCGDLIDKHGIFRVLPTQYKRTDGKVIKTPITLVRMYIDGENARYTAENDSLDHTLTWKIGDPDRTVNGVHNYQIVYKVENVISFYDTYDELFWNLSGNFWQIDIDSFNVNITFPAEINKNNTKMQVFSGYLNSQENSLASQAWSGETYVVSVNETMKTGQGVSLKATFPKNVFVVPPPSFADRFGLIILVLLSLIPVLLWNRFGKDPQLNKTVIPEFAIPDNLQPLEIWCVEHFNAYAPSLITAEIVQLAVNGYIKIEEIEKTKFLGLGGGKDYKITLLKQDFTGLKEYQHELIKVIFSATNKIDLTNIMNAVNVIKTVAQSANLNHPEVKVDQSIKISDIGQELAPSLQDIHRICANSITNAGYFNKSGFILKIVFLIVGFAMLVRSFFFLFEDHALSLMMAVPGLVFIIFGFLMTKRTVKGAETARKIKGFKLYMKVAEKYRQQFNEKENIFEKFLPYAIAFGMTELWIKKMKEIYGQEYFNTYHPVWYSGNVGNFDVTSFTSSMNAVSDAVSAASSSGGGGSGGGGGGGGGGGW